MLNNAGYDVAPDLFVTEFAAREAVYQAGAGDDAASLPGGPPKAAICRMDLWCTGMYMTQMR